MAAQQAHPAGCDMEVLQALNICQGSELEASNRGSGVVKNSFDKKRQTRQSQAVAWPPPYHAYLSAPSGRLLGLPLPFSQTSSPFGLPSSALPSLLLPVPPWKRKLNTTRRGRVPRPTWRCTPLNSWPPYLLGVLPFHLHQDQTVAPDPTRRTPITVRYAYVVGHVVEERSADNKLDQTEADVLSRAGKEYWQQKTRRG